MTVVDTVEVEVRANTSHVGPEVTRSTNAAAEKAGKAFGEILGKGAVNGLRLASFGVVGRERGKEAGAEFSEAFREKTSKLGEVTGIGGFKEFAKLGAYTLAATKGFDFLKESVKDAQDAQKAQLALGNSIRNNAQLAKGGATQFEEYAKKISEAGTFSQTQVEQSLAVSSSFKLSKDQIEKLTPAIDDYARKFGVALPQATKLFDRSATGSQAGLARLGIALDKAKFKADPFGTTLDALQRKAGGFDKAFSKTFAGALDQAKNKLEEVRVGVGLKLLPVLTNLLGSSVKVSTQLGKVLGPTFSAVGKAVTAFVTPLKNALGGTGLGGGKGIGAVFADIGAKIKTVTPAIVAFAGRVGAFLVPILKSLVGLWKNELSGVFSGLRSAFQKVSAAFRDGTGPDGGFGKLLRVLRSIATFVLDTVGPALGYLADKVLSGLGTAIAFLIKVIGGLVTAFEGIVPPILRAFGFILGGVQDLVRVVTAGFDAIVGTAASVAHALGFDGIGGKLDASKNAIDGFAAGVNSTLGSLASNASVYANSIENSLNFSISAAYAGQVAAHNAADLNSDDPKVAARARTRIAALKVPAKPKSAAPSALQLGFNSGIGAGLGGGSSGGGGGGGSKSPAKTIAKSITDAQKDALAAAKTLGQKIVSTLTTELSKFNAFKDAVKQAALQFTSITGLVSDPSLASAGLLISSLKDKLGAEKAFASNLSSLSKRGLSKAAIGELAQAGPEQRGLVSALAKATPAQIAQFNKLYGQSNAQSQALSVKASKAVYGDAPQRAAASLARVERLLATLNKQNAKAPADFAHQLAVALNGTAAHAQARGRTATPRSAVATR